MSIGGIIAMGNSIADRKIKQVSEMKHLEVKENFDYYNSIIDEIQENLDRLIKDFEIDESEYKSISYLFRQANLNRRNFNYKEDFQKFDLFKYMNLIRHGKNAEYLFRENSMFNFINYWYHLPYQEKVTYNNKEVLYNRIPLMKIKGLSYMEYYNEDILKELNINYIKSSNKAIGNKNTILIDINDLDKLTWMRDKYHPLSLKEFLETYNICYNVIQNYFEILNIKLVKPYNKKDSYFETQEDWNKMAELITDKKKRMNVLFQHKYGMTKSEFYKKDNKNKNKYIEENKIFTSKSAGKYLGITDATFRKYVKELNIKPIGKIKKIYNAYSIEQVELMKKVKHLDFDVSEYATINQLSKELDYYKGQCITALKSYNITPIYVQDIAYYPKEESIKVITKFKNCARSHRTSSLENGIKNILSENNIEFVENTKPFKSPNTNRQLELDIVIPSKRVAIEFDGIYYHSEGMLMCKYDYDDEKVLKLWNHNYYKTELGEQINLQVLHIRDVDFIKNHKTPQINSLINRFTLSPNTLLFDYDIKEVDYEESLKFHKENSIFNSDDFDKSFGLYQDDELIQLVSLKGNKIINYSVNNYVILSRDEERIIFDWIKKKFKKVSAEFIRDVYPTKYVEKLGFKIKEKMLPTYEYAFKNKFWDKDWVESGEGLKFFHEKGWIADYENIENMTEFLWNNKIAKYWNCGYLICEL